MTWRSFRNHFLNCDFTRNVCFDFRYTFVWNISHSTLQQTSCSVPGFIPPPEWLRVLSPQPRHLLPKQKYLNLLSVTTFGDVKLNWDIHMAYWPLEFHIAQFICHNALTVLVDIILKWFWKITWLLLLFSERFGYREIFNQNMYSSLRFPCGRKQKEISTYSW
jgi:hypothetical protein